MKMADDNLIELLHPSIRALVEKLKEKISSLQAAVTQKDEEILNLKHKASKKSSPGCKSISSLQAVVKQKDQEILDLQTSIRPFSAFLTNAESRSWSPVYDNKSVDGTRSWMPTTEVALREELEKARQSHGWGTNQSAVRRSGPRTSRGRPSLKDVSKRRRYRNRRTRGGKDTLGGLVV